MSCALARARSLGTLALCLLAVGAAVLGAAAAPARSAPRERTTLLNVEDALMCVLCHEPLALANSPQAQEERALVQQLIQRGETKGQILRVMVAQYGDAVLAKPPASGFNLLVYVLPPAVVIAGAALLAATLPRWRRRTRLSAELRAADGPPPLSAADAARLDQDLARFDG
jgi:cytochrome c-type biogenesis protein CcmH